MRNEDIQVAELVCFYTKKGQETQSAYEAQIWKSNSTSVYVRLKKNNGIVSEYLVKRIHFKYHHNAFVTIQNKKKTQKYELSNVLCDTRILPYNELGFFENIPSNPLASNEAWEHVITTPDDPNCSDILEKSNQAGKTISIVYIDEPHYSHPTIGIIPNILTYDSHSRIATTPAQKIFLLEK